MAAFDPDIEIMYVCRSNLVSRSQVRVIMSETYNRTKLPEAMENDLELVWSDRVSKNPKLYNGTKFRIDSVSFHGDILTLNLGVTCYKEYIGSNWSPRVGQYQTVGRQQSNNPQVHLSDPLGVGSFVLTSDNRVILLRRSVHCGEAPGLWDVPGGHAEPEELVGKKPFEEIDVSSMDSQAVTEEIFDSILREIRDEVNLPQSSLSDPEVLGIARNTTSAGRPSMEFLVRCSLTSEEVVSRYRQGSQAEADESTSIKMLPLEDAVVLKTKNPDLWGKLAPSGKGCFILYGLTNSS
ncbi:uridine diphosphate glucose pyrophosphatase NUDT22-like [Haliotis rufescens]|uniref:uridine diphosphate glucose pyrophosphatase NUDT22-like n=1 Tax=Haliotis rufescens TaxID=6454 RepID=UPI001EB01C93|nr:uridine diphosphate glucose pyrophosphatase NUDT22-like [Haliotis rufescens]